MIQERVTVHLQFKKLAADKKRQIFKRSRSCDDTDVGWSESGRGVVFPTQGSGKL